MNRLILVRGLPGSGKSTLAAKLAKASAAIHLEADQFFHQGQSDYNFDATKLYQAHKWCLGETRRQLELENLVIVSNTFTTKKELKPYFELAQEFGHNPVVYLAQSQFKSIHGVPEETMNKMRGRFAFDISDMFLDRGVDE